MGANPPLEGRLTPHRRPHWINKMTTQYTTNSASRGHEDVPVRDEDSKELVEDEDECSSRPFKMQGGSLRRYSKFEGRMGNGRHHFSL